MAEKKATKVTKAKPKAAKVVYVAAKPVATIKAFASSKKDMFMLGSKPQTRKQLEDLKYKTLEANILKGKLFTAKVKK